MTGRPSLLSAEVQADLVASIRAGAYDWVAAESAGIGRRTFYRWLERGETGDRKYARLLAEVRRARADARRNAEQAVHLRDPLSWLRLGPGRERQEEPGWTAPQKPPVLAAIEGELRQLMDDVLSKIPLPGRKRAAKRRHDAG